MLISSIWLSVIFSSWLHVATLDSVAHFEAGEQELHVHGQFLDDHQFLFEGLWLQRRHVNFFVTLALFAKTSIEQLAPVVGSSCRVRLTSSGHHNESCRNHFRLNFPS